MIIKNIKILFVFVATSILTYLVHHFQQRLKNQQDRIDSLVTTITKMSMLVQNVLDTQRDMKETQQKLLSAHDLLLEAASQPGSPLKGAIKPLTFGCKHPDKAKNGTQETDGNSKQSTKPNGTDHHKPQKSHVPDVRNYLADREALKHAKLDLLSKMKVLEKVPSATLEKLAQEMIYEVSEAGTPIVREGDYGDCMYFVASGEVEVFVGSKHIRNLKEGAYFGEVALLYGSVRSATCVAKSRSELFILNRDPFLAMCDAQPSARRELEKAHYQREEDSKYTLDERLNPSVRAKVLAAVDRRLAAFDAKMQAKGWANSNGVGAVSLRWQERELLGKGAYGSVYSAVDLETGRPLAVKSVSTGRGVSQTFLRQVRQESELLQRLSHPNIVKGFGIQTDEENAYVLMELLPNGSLEDLLKDCGPLSESAARHYTEQLLRGLLYLHGEGVLHRDIKPANLLLSESGDVKLADFGISKLGLGTKTAATNSLAGTPAYLSPEAISGRYSIASDVWAVGCTVLQLVTGRMPWSEKTFDSLTQMIFHIASVSQPPSIPDPAPMGENGGSSSHSTLFHQSCTASYRPFSTPSQSVVETVAHSFHTRGSLLGASQQSLPS